MKPTRQDVRTYKGYTEGQKLCKELTYIDQFGNAKFRYVKFADTDGNILTWQTTDYNKTYRSLKLHEKVLYRFRVDYVFSEHVNINYLRVVLANLSDGGEKHE